MQIRAQRAAEKSLVFRNPALVIGSEPLDSPLPQPIDTAVTDMEEMGRGRFEYEGAEGGEQSASQITASLALAVEPGIERCQHLLCGLLHRPGLRGAEIIL